MASNKGFSPAEIRHLENGPFPGRIDPWAEETIYLKQIHAGMISHIMSQLQDNLMVRGYVAGLEISLQILADREPDVFTQAAMYGKKPHHHWNRWKYEELAQSINVDAGYTIETDFRRQGIHIKEMETANPLTIIEIIIPQTKSDSRFMADYRARREHLLVEHGLNFIEIDLTRSPQRLLNANASQKSSYHAVIFFAGESPQFIEMDYGKPLKSLALPLHSEVMFLDLQAAYDYGYQLGTISLQIYRNQHYTEANLSFPSLLTETQRQEALVAVNTWKAQLEHLRKES